MIGGDGFSNVLKKNRAVIDANTNKLYFLGPGDYDLDKAVPPGTDILQCEMAPGGHIVAPCCEREASSSITPHRSLVLRSRGPRQGADTGRGRPEGAAPSLPRPPFAAPMFV